MDDLEVAGEVVDQTLRELDFINRFLGGNKISLAAFKNLLKNTEQATIADLGSGGGDILMTMADWSRKQGKKFSFLGIDANAHIVAYAKSNCIEYEELAFECQDILSPEFARQSFDVIHCCLFTHHFTNEELIRLFRQFRAQSKVGVVINDLHRHPLAYHSIKVLTRLFSKSEMVKYDAPLSVARGFRRKELEHILHEAGIPDYNLSWKWAFRWKIVF